jgi:predicted transcriptional regulator
VSESKPAAPLTIGAMPSFDRRPRRQRASKDPIARYLGELQAEVMGIFWERGSATVRAVLEELNKRRRRRRKDEFAYTTVLTVVSRLWSRDLLSREPEGRGFRYQATRTRDELLGELSDELINRLLDDFGEIAVARLGARLDDLDPSRLRKLKREGGKQ